MYPPFDVSVYYGSIRHGVEIMEGRGYVTRHLQPALGGECGVVGEVCLQGTVTHEWVDEAELRAVATVGQDREKTLVGQPIHIAMAMVVL